MAISGAVPGATPPAGGSLSSFASDDNISGMRIAVPVIKAVSGIKAARDYMNFSNNARFAYDGIAGGYRGARGMGFGGAVGGGFHSFFGAIRSNFLISAGMSIFTNLIDLVRGKSSGTQFLANTVADTAAYTAIGASATAIGAMVGSIVPGIGTIIGMGVGALVGFLGGKLYEDKLRPSLTSGLAAKFTGSTGGNFQLTPPAQQPGLPAGYAPTPAPAPTWPR
jgi:hypothetical protein